MEIKKLLTSLCMLVAVPAIASPWTMVTTNEDSTQGFLIRLDSIRHHENNFASFWLADVPTDETLPYDVRIAVVLSNCNDQKYQVLQVNTFKDGNLLTKSKAVSKVDRSLPGTVMSEAILLACLKDRSNLVPGYFPNPKRLATDVRAFLLDLQKKNRKK